MTQLLISVKNVEEAQVARYAGVDLIDLKDPSVGALGALDVEVVKQIVQDVNGSTLVSATVGEGHETVDALIHDIVLYDSLEVDVVKVAVSELFQQADFFTKISQLTAQGIKVVAVFFANQPLDLSLISTLQHSGFYGAMIDTQLKQLPLLTVQPAEVLRSFVAECEQCGLISGLAGSVNKTHLNALLVLNPSFIGMRGGVCYQHERTAMLVEGEVAEIKTVLLNYNNTLKAVEM